MRVKRPRRVEGEIFWHPPPIERFAVPSREMMMTGGAFLIMRVPNERTNPHDHAGMAGHNVNVPMTDGGRSWARHRSDEDARPHRARVGSWREHIRTDEACTARASLSRARRHVGGKGVLSAKVTG